MSEEPETPEQKARNNIDDMLGNNGWDHIESSDGKTGYKEEVFTERGNKADYVLYIEGVPIAIVEAKKKSVNIRNKRDQAHTYAENLNTNDKYRGIYSVPYIYVTNGEEIIFEDLRRDARKLRYIHTFHTPQNLTKLEKKNYTDIMSEINGMDSEDIDKSLWDHQAKAFDNGLDIISDKENKMFYQMATGSGKTRLGMAISYALLECGFANRVLFAVDTDQLRDDTRKDYKKYDPLGSDNFTHNYIVGDLNEYEESNCDVVVTTTQKLSRRLHSDSHNYTVGEFDLVIADEAHRGVFNKEGLGIALDYFDAFEIGLTATPHKGTKRRYDNNLAYKYDYNAALKDNYVVPFRTYKVDTKLMMNDEEGIRYKGKKYTSDDIGNKIIIRDVHRKVSEALRDDTNVRNELTLVFANNRDHAQYIVDDFRDEYSDLFDNPRQAIQKVTGDSFEPKVTLSEFKQPYRPPYIIVTVDMVTTGVDIRPLNNIVMLRPVRSKVLFNQMMGRGTRTHETKDHFKIFDCVGSFEYHDGLPPFVTGDIEYSSTSSTSGTTIETPSDDPEVIHDKNIDEIVRNARMFPSMKNEWVERDKFIKEVRDYVNRNSTLISSEIKDCKSIEEADKRIEDVLVNEWKHYRRDTILDAFKNTDSLFMFCVRTIEGYEKLREKSRIARKATAREHSISDKKGQKILKDISHRAVIEKRNITKNDFFNPPLSSNWGLDGAKNTFDNLDEILDTFNRQFLNIETDG